MPKVSVIIPTYNRAALINDAIDSVLSQTYDDFELLVIDDGSTDDTKEVISKYDSAKLRYIYQENKGRSAARNKGIELATGEYIAFLDSDDIFMTCKLELQVQALDNNKSCGLVYSHATNIDKSGNSLDYHFEGNLSGWIYPELLFIKNNFMTTPTVMVRSRVLSELGGFDETMHICEDLDLWRRIARNYKVMHLCQPLAMIRILGIKNLNLLEAVKGRTRYYNKAIDEDPSLESIKKELFSELYKVYFDYGIYQENYPVAIYMLFKTIINDPIHMIKRLLQKAKCLITRN